MTKKKQKKTEASEPQVQYDVSKEKRIYFFSSLEEEEQSNHKYFASLSPSENIQNVTKRLKSIYAAELALEPGLGNRIYFD